TSGVTITDDSFSAKSYAPNPITINVGDSVTWTNNGPTTHTVTSDSGSAMSFDSGNLPAGQTFTETFPAAGTFTYHCTIHPSMTGSVVVQAAGASSPTAGSAAPTTAPTTAPPAAATAATAATPPAAAAGGTGSTPAAGAGALPSTGSGPSDGNLMLWVISAFVLGMAGVTLAAVSFRRRAR
ncbi:MAG TPA: plastocyanin/azurin family copper-binding protein, partial [Dehalococcoidia bacterium]